MAETDRVHIEGKATKAGSASASSFRDLVERSIQAWNSLTFVGQNKDEEFEVHTRALRKLTSIDGILSQRKFWFFQLRNSFMEQDVMMKWDSNRLDEYILLPISYGFVNNQDCYFISHYWRTKKHPDRDKDHPDRDGEDSRTFKQYLQKEEWSYIWVDWTCMPQKPRTEIESKYFKLMLQCIPMIVRDCGFMWKYLDFEPRAWILYEVAEFVLNHSGPISADDPTDILPFIRHTQEMKETSVRAVLEKYEYRCTNGPDLPMVTGWLEMLVILEKVIPNVSHRQEVWDWVNKGETGSFSDPLIYIDKVKGEVRQGKELYRFTPVYFYKSKSKGIFGLANPFSKFRLWKSNRKIEVT